MQKTILSLALYTLSIQAQNDIIVKQLESPYTTIIKMNKERTFVRVIYFYFPLHITKMTNDETEFSMLRYHNSSTDKDSSIPLYIDHIGKCGILFQGDQRNRLKRCKSENFIITSPHFLREDSPEQSLFSNYLKKMQELGKDSLQIGTISELKKKDPNVLQILNGDSIIFYYKKEGITYNKVIPIEIK